MRAVNLIPADRRERSVGYANRSSGVAYAVLGVFALLALMALLYGVAKHDVTSKEAEATRYEAEAARVQAQATSLAPYKTFVAMREGREDAVRELVDTRFDWAHSLAEFGRVLPPGTAISSLEGCITPPSTTAGGGGEGASCGSSSSGAGGKSASVSSATPAGSVPHFTISGCATSQSTVARMLADLRLIDGVSSAELESATKSGTGGGGGGGGANAGCQNGQVSFGAKVAFQPLPSPPSGSSAKTVPAASESHAGSGRPE
jgi:hypothetical protein